MAPYEEEMLTGDALKKRIISQIGDMFMMWLYYDRKEDYEVPPEAIEKAVKDGVISKDEIILAFHRNIEENFS